jgi:hypothetical protein
MPNGRPAWEITMGTTGDHGALHRVIGLALFLLLLASTPGCGGGGSGGGAGSGLNTEAVFSQLIPLGSRPAGTQWVYDVNRTDTLVGNSFRERTFTYVVIDDPTGPDVMGVGDMDRLSHSGGFRRLSTGYEIVGYDTVATSSLLGVFPLPVDVTTISPGVMVLPFSLRPGGSYDGSIPGLFDFTVHWDGQTGDLAGYPNAHRFRVTATGPHLTEPGVTVDITATVYFEPGVGPVQGNVTRDFLTGPTLVRRTTYSFLFDRFGP